MRAFLLAVLASLLAPPLGAQEAPSWCRTLLPGGMGRVYACGKGGTVEEAAERAYAALARQIHAQVTDSLSERRTVSSYRGAGGLGEATVEEEAGSISTLTTDVALRGARILRVEEAAGRHWAMALFDVSDALLAAEDMALAAEDSLAHAQIRAALSLRREAQAALDSVPWAFAERSDSRRHCRLMREGVYRQLEVELVDEKTARLSWHGRGVVGVRLLLLRAGRDGGLRVTLPSDEQGVVTLSSLYPPVGGGEAIEEIDVDWRSLGERLGPFTARAVRRAAGARFPVRIAVERGLVAADRASLEASVLARLEDLGWRSAAEAAAAPTLRVIGRVRDVPPLLGQVPAAVATVTWTLTGEDGALLAQGAVQEVPGEGIDQVKARAAALATGASRLVRALEGVAARLRADHQE